METVRELDHHRGLKRWVVNTWLPMAGRFMYDGIQEVRVMRIERDHRKAAMCLNCVMDFGMDC